MKSRPAIFIDRDGTINEEKHFLIDPQEFEFIPGVPQALQRLQEAGYLLVVISNQSGVARGYFSEEQVAQLHLHMQQLLEAYSVRLAAIYICPHHPTAGQGDYRQDCACRKGKPGLLLQAAEELGIELSASFMIGDKVSDAEAGLAAGCRAVLVQTGYGAEHRERAKTLGVPAVTDLSAAADLILTSENQ